jgi:hypothetical protein
MRRSRDRLLAAQGLRRTRLLLIPAALTFAACGESSARAASVVVDTLPGGIPRTMSSAPTAPGSIQLVELAPIQPAAESPEELLQPTSVAVADDGSVIVADRGSGQIKVFDADGRFVRAFGRKGAGPNEYQVAFLAVRGDTLLVQDPQVSRLTRVLWRSGTLIDQTNSPCCYWVPIDIDADGYAWLRNGSSPDDSTFTHYQGFVRVPVSAGPSDTLMAYERKGLPAQQAWEIRLGDRMQMSMAIPFQPRAHFTPDPTGRLLTGYSGEYSIRETRDGRDTVAIFGRTWTAEPVSADEKQQLVDARIARQTESPGPVDEATYRRAMDPGMIPNQRPAYSLLHVDRSGRRWVELDNADSLRKRFDVFSREGVWLDSVHVARAAWPAESYAVAWGRDRLAIPDEDADGRPLIRVFAIRRR